MSTKNREYWNFEGTNQNVYYPECVINPDKYKEGFYKGFAEAKCFITVPDDFMDENPDFVMGYYDGREEYKFKPRLLHQNNTEDNYCRNICWQDIKWFDENDDNYDSENIHYIEHDKRLINKCEPNSLRKKSIEVTETIEKTCYSDNVMNRNQAVMLVYELEKFNTQMNEFDILKADLSELITYKEFKKSIQILIAIEKLYKKQTDVLNDRNKKKLFDVLQTLLCISYDQNDEEAIDRLESINKSFFVKFSMEKAIIVNPDIYSAIKQSRKIENKEPIDIKDKIEEIVSDKLSKSESNESAFVEKVDNKAESAGVDATQEPLEPKDFSENSITESIETSSQDVYLIEDKSIKEEENNSLLIDSNVEKIEIEADGPETIGTNSEPRENVLDTEQADAELYKIKSDKETYETPSDDEPYELPSDDELRDDKSEVEPDESSSTKESLADKSVEISPDMVVELLVDEIGDMIVQTVRERLNNSADEVSKEVLEATVDKVSGKVEEEIAIGEVTIETGKDSTLLDEGIEELSIEKDLEVMPSDESMIIELSEDTIDSVSVEDSIEEALIGEVVEMAPIEDVIEELPIEAYIEGIPIEEDLEEPPFKADLGEEIVNEDSRYKTNVTEKAAEESSIKETQKSLLQRIKTWFLNLNK